MENEARRRHAPSTHLLEEQVDTARTTLQGLLDKVLDNMEPQEVTEVTQAIKDAFKCYKLKAMTLTKRLKDIGHVERSKDLRTERLAFKEEVNECLSLLRELEGDMYPEDTSQVSITDTTETSSKSQVSASEPDLDLVPAPAQFSNNLNLKGLPTENRASRTQSYINELAELSIQENDLNQPGSNPVVEPPPQLPISQHLSTQPNTTATSNPYQHHSSHAPQFNASVLPGQQETSLGTYHQQQPTSFLPPALVNSHVSPSSSAATQNLPDFASFFLIKQMLFQKTPEPFNGDPYMYQTWYDSFMVKIRGLPLTSSEILMALQADTIGEPQKLVEEYRAIGSRNPDLALQNVWDALKNKFGSNIRIETALAARVNNFTPIKNPRQTQRLEELIRLCDMILYNMPSCPGLQRYNEGTGIRKIWLKLPSVIQHSWRSICCDDKSQDAPAFATFVAFIRKNLNMYSNPLYEIPSTEDTRVRDVRTYATKTEPEPETSAHSPGGRDVCLLHPSATHLLKDCKIFASKPFEDRRKILLLNGLCFRCLGKHRQSDCNQKPKCDKCEHPHATAMHKSPAVRRTPTALANANQPADSPRKTMGAVNLCTTTRARQSKPVSRMCSKVVLVDICLPSRSSKSMRCYAFIDEQSDSSFADPKVADFFGIHGPLVDYKLFTMENLQSTKTGIEINGIQIKGAYEERSFHLPSLITSDSIPQYKSLIAEPNVVKAHKHIAHFAKYFREPDKDTEILLLLGADSGHVMNTKCYGHKPPFVHHTALGWALVGKVSTEPSSVPGHQVLTVHTDQHNLSVCSKLCFSRPEKPWKIPDVRHTFEERHDDENPGPSQETQKFLDIVSSNISTNAVGNLTMPLPFRKDDPVLPDNRKAVFHRTHNTLERLKKEPAKLSQCIEVMQKYLDAEHVEPVPLEELEPSRPGKAWWIPIFPVTHPKKHKVRLVFDSSAKYQGTSLNAELLAGPDLNNRLRAVLLRFRLGAVAFAADIESMFHGFFLQPQDKDFTRFYWFNKNDAKNGLSQFRANVHIFGNCSSPAIATLGLRHAVNCPDFEVSPETRDFVERRFYVDDGLGTADSPQQAINILTETRKVLSKFNIRLHKICSNNKEVLHAFPASEVITDPRELELNHCGERSIQQTLGLSWNIASDEFIIRTNVPERPFTKRGVLSTINSIFDPLGFASPIVLTGRLIQRAIISTKPCTDQPPSNDWDNPLPPDHLEYWKNWKRDLVATSGFAVSRGYCPPEFGKVKRRELHAFSDASKDAIGFVVYLRSCNDLNEVHVAFVCASSKVAPRAALTIPRLELCAAMDASIAVKQLTTELNIDLQDVYLYTDSKIVMGYITNQTKTFSMYITRRVNMLLKCYSAQHWSYVTTEENPADMASRPHDHVSLSMTCWLRGPRFLWLHGKLPRNRPEPDEELPETLIEAISLLTNVGAPSGGLQTICDKVSSWNRAVKVVQIATSFACRLLDKYRKSRGSYIVQRPPVSFDAAVKILIEITQKGALPEIFRHLSSSSGNLPSDHVFAPLSPFVDADGLIRVGGRLRHSELTAAAKFPILLPRNHAIAKLIFLHYHQQVKHQGRVLTQGAIREAGFFIHRSSKFIKDEIAKCVLCRRLRGTFVSQQMSDLPADRLQETPPFTNCGLDALGPFYVTDGYTTRRSRATKKVWAVLFTCLVSRAVHVEPLHAMDTSAFKNALRRFFALRGTCKRIRCDMGTNFIGNFNQENATVSLNDLETEAQIHGCQWQFNPPKASHHGGVWERKIQSVKKILDASLLLLGPRSISRDEFTTFLAEATSIVNNTPLSDISEDPNDPVPLSPAMLLTLKSCPNPATLEDYTERDILAYGKRRWRRIQYLAEQFWIRWRKEYIQNLQPRRKWLHQKPSLKTGDVVLVRNLAMKRNHWPIGRVMETKCSADGRVRTATIRVGTPGNFRSFLRPITELVLLMSGE